MSDTRNAADVCDELAAALDEIARDGKAHERIDEINAACERAAREIGEIMKR